MTNKDFELIEHTADLKIRVYGSSLQKLFIHALQGMFQAIRPIAPSCSYLNDRLVCKELPKKHLIEVSSPDSEALLVDFLSEALYLSDCYNEAYLDAVIEKLTNTSIKAQVCGIEVEGFEVVEIKAVTYHDLIIKQVDNHWQVDIVFDI